MEIMENQGAYKLGFKAPYAIRVYLKKSLPSSQDIHFDKLRTHFKDSIFSSKDVQRFLKISNGQCAVLLKKGLETALVLRGTGPRTRYQFRE
jgi:hypothetical protein